MAYNNGEFSLDIGPLKIRLKGFSGQAADIALMLFTVAGSAALVGLAGGAAIAVSGKGGGGGRIK
jgi:hypothetical protein